MLPSLLIVIALLVLSRRSLWASLALVPVCVALGLAAVLRVDAMAAWAYWLTFWTSLIGLTISVTQLGLAQPRTRGMQLAAKALPSASVPCFLLLLWQGLVVGFDVPRGIFPSVGDVVIALQSSLPVLLNDSYVTFVQEIALGFALGVPSGILIGIAVAYSRFLQRGFLPLAAAFGAVPIVGLAPVLGRAFGVDWQSKAAVVVIVTFFPVLLNTVQGLTLVDTLKLELLHAYASSPLTIFRKLRLPNALPYLFNALKVAAVVSVISVIVAEFLIPGPPRGLGQRISLSARQGAYDVVFAAIFVSSVISITIYGVIVVLERVFTGWHPSLRGEGS
jgi:NitT/TauT family transport system permease protein